MIDFINGLFDVLPLFFGWLPNYVYSFVCSAFNIIGIIFLVLIFAKIGSIALKSVVSFFGG